MNNKAGLVAELKNSLTGNIRQYMMFIALIGIITVFTVLNPLFLSPRNLSTLFLQTAHIAILTCGVVLVIVAGHIDLSIGSVVGLLGAIAALLESRFDLGIVWVVLITIGAGILIGLWQGYWVAYQKVPAFIVTLAGMFIFGKGLLLFVTQGRTTNVSDTFKLFGSGYVPPIFVGLDAGFNDTAIIASALSLATLIFLQFRKRSERAKYGFENESSTLFAIKLVLISVGLGAFSSILIFNRGIPYSILITCIVAVVYSFIAKKTRFGRHVFAIGGNKEAAALSGIDIRRRTLMVFVSSGILGAIGGLVFTARIGSATAAAGTGMELEVIAAAIIGGTSTRGGEGTIVGAIVGALVMATLTNGMLLLNSPEIVRHLVNGMVLLLAVWLDVKTRKDKTL